MNLLGPTSLYDFFVHRSHFNITGIDLSDHEMYDDLYQRVEAQDRPWCFAMIVGISDADPNVMRGMLLLEKVAEGHYLGLYYPRANCGDMSDASLITAKMLALIDDWPDEEALSRTITAYPRLRITNIGELDVATRGGHDGPTIEPISGE